MSESLNESLGESKIQSDSLSESQRRDSVIVRFRVGARVILIF